MATVKHFANCLFLKETDKHEYLPFPLKILHQIKLFTHFFSYKTDFFPSNQSQKSRSILQDGSRSFGLSYKRGIDLWECLGRVKTCIIAKFHRTDLVICSHSGEEKNPVL